MTIAQPEALNFECETGNYHTFCRLAAWRGYTRRLKIASFGDWHEDLWLFLAKRHGSDFLLNPTRWRNWKKGIAKLNDYEELKRCNQIKRDRNPSVIVWIGTYAEIIRWI